MHNITPIYRNKSRKNNSRRAFRNRMAGYSPSNNRHRGRMPLLCALALLLSAILLGACPDDNNGNGDSDDGNGRSDVTPSPSTAVTDVTISNITPTALTLNWTNPADSDGFEGVLISAEPAGGTAAMPQQQAASATTAEITDLNPITTYSFTLTSMYTDDRKNNAIPAPPTMTPTSADLPIDADGDELIDITSLERLNNIRHNLDLSNGRYKTSADTAENSGLLCGTDQDMPCTGYELIISLDFANPHHYESGELNAAWRPNSMANNSGSILPQTMADNGTNNGWEPIGTGSDGSRFNSRFDGNGHTISNLYIRRSGEVGLFGGTDSASVIRSVGVAAVQIYNSSNISGNTPGALVANNRGIIVASYASGTITNSGTAAEIGGLVGALAGANTAIVASYATVSINNSSGGDNSVPGGLIGAVATSQSSVIASYANAVIDGNGDIGGLIGQGDVSAIIRATYASGMLRGGGGTNLIGGLIGNGSNTTVVASYATATIDGGEGIDIVGALGGFNVITTASYGFGSVTGETVNTIGAPPTMGAATAADLTVDTAGTQWNDATELTLDAWDFGTSTQAPALKYADYDGAGTNYGCGDDSMADIVIPSVVATPTGPMTITCGTTLLPQQVR